MRNGRLGLRRGRLGLHFRLRFGPDPRLARGRSGAGIGPGSRTLGIRLTAIRPSLLIWGCLGRGFRRRLGGLRFRSRRGGLGLDLRLGSWLLGLGLGLGLRSRWLCLRLGLFRLSFRSGRLGTSLRLRLWGGRRSGFRLGTFGLGLGLRLSLRLGLSLWLLGGNLLGRHAVGITRLARRLFGLR